MRNYSLACEVTPAAWARMHRSRTGVFTAAYVTFCQHVYVNLRVLYVKRVSTELQQSPVSFKVQ